MTLPQENNPAETNHEVFDFLDYADYSPSDRFARMIGVAISTSMSTKIVSCVVEPHLVENFPNEPGLIAGKHSNHIPDICLYGLIAHRLRLQKIDGRHAPTPVFVTKDDHLKGLWLKTKFLEKGGAVIPVARNTLNSASSNKRNLVEGTRHYNQQGRDVIIFPEGGSRHKKKVGPLKRGVITARDCIEDQELPVTVMALRQIGQRAFALSYASHNETQGSGISEIETIMKGCWARAGEEYREWPTLREALAD